MSEPGASGSERSLTALYRDAIRRHASEPAGFNRSIDPTHTHEAYNALCGDRVNLQLRVEGETVAEAAFDGEACAICTASASMLCSLAPGEPVERLRRWALELENALKPPVGADSSAMTEAADSGAKASGSRSRMNPLPQCGGDTSLPDDLLPLLGVRPYPSRVRCATLPWEAAAAALSPNEATGN